MADAAQRQRLLSAIDTVLQHGRLVLGPEVQELERRVAARCGRKYAVGVDSGSTALLLGLRSVAIGPGDEVITTPLSWIATANAIAVAGATPVFADIGDDLNLDPTRVRELVTPRTRAIVPVHWTGKVCRMHALMEIADRHGLAVVEDAAQAFDASRHGRKAGSFGEVGCFSMNAMKVFAACGDAGMVVTDREDVYQRLLALRYNGTVNREKCVDVSLNGRLDTVQAAILLQRLEHVEGIIERRREVAGWYGEHLEGVVETPREAPGERDAWYTYTIRADRRDELKAFLESRGIETRIHHPYLMPEQPVYREAAQGKFPNAQRLVSRVLCLPSTEKITRAEVEYVAACIREFYGAAPERSGWLPASPAYGREAAE